MKNKSNQVDLSALTVTHSTDQLVIELKWRSFVYNLALILGIVAVTVMIITQWQTLTFSGFTFEEKPYAIVMVAVTFALLAFTYYCTVRFFNKTRIIISNDRVSIIHEPLPWHKNSVLFLSEIKAVEVKVRREKTRQGQGPPFFRLEAKLAEGKWKLITPYHEDEDLIREIETLIRKQIKAN